MMSKNHQTFTLIELLVVIAIIAILMAILFPSLRRALEMSKLISCKSNHKQMYVALGTYCEDFDYTYPEQNWQEGYWGSGTAVSAYKNATYGHQYSAMGKVWAEKYLGNREIFLDPGLYNPPTSSSWCNNGWLNFTPLPGQNNPRAWMYGFYSQYFQDYGFRPLDISGSDQYIKYRRRWAQSPKNIHRVTTPNPTIATNVIIMCWQEGYQGTRGTHQRRRSNALYEDGHTMDLDVKTYMKWREFGTTAWWRTTGNDQIWGWWEWAMKEAK